MTTTQDTGTSCLAAALAYASHGRAVFPCVGKRPLVDHGCLDATTDEMMIRQWWQRWPDANVAIATGDRSGIYVIDEDADGAETISRLGLPATRTVRTGKGRHFYFVRPDVAKMPNTSKKLGPGVDTRGDGGYVLAPPSVHPETRARYSVEQAGALAELPQHILDIIIPKARETIPVPRERTSSARSYAEAALLDECEQVANALEGSRNHTLNVAAFSLGQLIGAGVIDEETVRADLHTAARRAGLDDDEIEQTMDSGLVAGRSQPRQIPNRPPPAARPRTQPPKEPDEVIAGDPRRDAAFAAAKDRIVSRRISRSIEIPLGGHNAAEMARTTRPDVEWIIRNTLQRAAVGVIGAEYKGCKTWLACELALSLSTGQPFLGREKWTPEKKARVLFVAMEDGENNMNSRLKAMAHGRRMHTDEALALINVIPRPEAFDIATLEGQAFVAMHALAMPEPPAVVILDPLGNIHKAPNENDSAEMLKVMNGLRILRDSIDATIMTTHHMGKPPAEARGPSKGRLVHRLRGSSAIFQAIDAWMLLDQKSEERTDDFNRWEAALQIGTREGGGGYADAELDVRLKPNGTAKIAAWTLTDGKRKSEGEETKNKILRAMDGWQSTPDLARVTGIADRTVRTHLAELEEEGLVHRDDADGKKNTKWRKEGE